MDSAPPSKNFEKTPKIPLNEWFKDVSYCPLYFCLQLDTAKIHVEFREWSDILVKK